jgi:D-alanyl-D-alanine carboxypeptidase (penicillin-binding protein 5/6)
MGTDSEPKRFEETRKLLDYGFNNFEKKDIIPAKAEIDTMKTVELKKGVKTSVPVVTESALSMVVKKGTTDDQIAKTAEPIEESKRVAPIKQGDVLGTVKVTYNGKDQTVNLVASEDVDKGSWIRLLFRAIKNFFVDLFSGIKNMF